MRSELSSFFASWFIHDNVGRRLSAATDDDRDELPSFRDRTSPSNISTLVLQLVSFAALNYEWDFSHFLLYRFFPFCFYIFEQKR